MSTPAAVRLDEAIELLGEIRDLVASLLHSDFPVGEAAVPGITPRGVDDSPPVSPPRGSDYDDDPFVTDSRLKYEEP